MIRTKETFFVNEKVKIVEVHTTPLQRRKKKRHNARNYVDKEFFFANGKLLIV